MSTDVLEEHIASIFISQKMVLFKRNVIERKNLREVKDRRTCRPLVFNLGYAYPRGYAKTS
jgi:hypothetical protein